MEGSGKEGMQFFLLMDPPTVTAQEKRISVSRNGKPIVYENERLREAKAKIRAYLAAKAPKTPYTCGVRLVVKWCFLDNNHRHKHGEYKITKPDTDNLQKMLKDVMTGVGFWKDDALVASEIVEKFWVRGNPGIGIEVVPLGMDGEQ